MTHKTEVKDGDFVINLQLFGDEGIDDEENSGIIEDEDTELDNLDEESEDIEGEDSDEEVEGDDEVAEEVEVAPAKPVNYAELFKATKPQAVQPVVQQSTDANSTDPIEVLKGYINTAIAQAVNPFQTQAADMQIEVATARMIANYKDFPKYAEAAVETLKNNQALWNLPNAMEVAYKMAKADGMDSAVTTAKQTGKNEAYKGQQSKKKAFVEGQSNKRQATSKSVADTIGDSIVGMSRPRL